MGNSGQAATLMSAIILPRGLALTASTKGGRIKYRPSGSVSRCLIWIETFRAARSVTDHPTAEWIARQITDAFPWDEAGPATDINTGPMEKSENG